MFLIQNGNTIVVNLFLQIQSYYNIEHQLSTYIICIFIYIYIQLYIYICIVQNIEDDVFDVFRDRRQTNLPYNVYFINNKHIIIDVT